MRSIASAALLLVACGATSPPPPRATGSLGDDLSKVDLTGCRAAGAQRGAAHVTVVVAPSGEVTSAVVDGGTLLGTPVGRCVEETLKALRLAPASGPATKIGRTLRVD